MLRLYYARENVDKERFMFEEIEKTLERFRREPSKQQGIFLVVPDQFTLQAEREAFSYMKTEGLMDLDIVSQTRLGFRILNEVGGSTRMHIDKYGRHMLLARIIAETDDKLQAFASVKNSHAFVELANDLITEMKQYNITPELLPEKIAELPETVVLVEKLQDLHKIYQQYEQMLQGKYMDNEDYINLVTSKVRDSRKIACTEIWITGFLSFTPNSMKLMEQLVCHSLNVNIIMTGDDGQGRDKDLFQLTRSIVSRLSWLAERNQVQWQSFEIPASQELQISRKKSLNHLEQELYAYPQRSSRECDGICFCQAANYYLEAETAATEIVQLVRDQGLRYQDIGVICNDMETRGSVIRRVFTEYGIPVFLDCKRTVLHSPAVELILSLLDVIENNWSFDDVFRLIKTGLIGERTREQWEQLENYCLQYKIRGNSWKKPFKYGQSTLEEGRLEELEQLRQHLASFLVPFEEEWKRGKTVKQRTAALYEFLQNRLRLPGRLQQLQQTLLQRKELEQAEELGQIWAVVIALLDQMVELLGEEELPPYEYGQLLQSGFQSVEIGILPPSEDLILVGTMQRTRTGRQRALLVLGANDGVLPAISKDKSLLNDDEKAYLFEKNISICKDDTTREQEEKMAIYKALSVPSEYLWISYAATDLEGKECKPSMIFNRLLKMYPDATRQKDVENRQDWLALAQTRGSAMNHMTQALEQVAAGTGEAAAMKPWKAVYNWMLGAKEEFIPERELAALRTGLLFDNRVERLERSLTAQLYGAGEGLDLLLSPSRLEKFGRCPFAHFVQYGLRPEERRIFEIAGREVGDAYHECLMRLSQELSVEGVAVTAPESPWMLLTEEECHSKIRVLMEEVAEDYREGILSRGEEERYRAERMAQVCEKAAWALVSHVQAGTIEQIYFEAEFGKDSSKPFPAIEVQAGDRKVRIEGKIDRVDVLPGHGDTSYVKVIDYKSGKERFDMEEARVGWRLQLMLYLEAAVKGLNSAEKSTQPAGVFYFEIGEPMVEERQTVGLTQVKSPAAAATGENEAVKAEMPAEEMERAEAAAGELAAAIKDKLMRSFKMDGILLDDPAVIDSMDGGFDGHSAIIPVQKKKDGTISGSSEHKLLKEEEFAEFRQQVDETIQQLCQELAGGSAAIEPRRSKGGNACQYCSFRSICQFDTMFDGCRYR